MKLIRDNLSLIAAIAGAGAAIIAFLVKTDEKIVYNIILLSTIFLILLAILVKSYFDKNNDQHSLYSFFTDDLPPNKTKKFLGIKTDIVIIEAVESQSIFETLFKEFQEIKGVKVTHCICDSSDIELQKGKLLDDLSGAESVIVVRTKELDNKEKEWVHETLEKWSFQNSHVPCLVIDKIDPSELKQLKLSPVLEKYFFIPDDRNSLPWRLLKRANERAFAWRNQASFNRLVAISLILLLLTGFMIYFFASALQRNEYEKLLQGQKSNYDSWVQGQKSNYDSWVQGQREDYDNLLREISNEVNDPKLLKKIFRVIAKQTKTRFEKQFMNGIQDDTLNVSYWFNYKGKLYQLASTHDLSEKNDYPNNKTSVIGCAFSHTNHVVGWNNITGERKIRAYNEQTDFSDNECEYQSYPDMKFKYLICSARSKPEIPDNLVGICIFTGNENNKILSYDYHLFVRDRAIEFFEFVKNKKLIPQ